MRKHLDSPWAAPAEACKRLETFYCQVTGINAGQSVAIARIVESGTELSAESLKSAALNPQHKILSTAACGNVSLKGGKIDRLRVGSILKIEGFGLTPAGKIREPRPCKDTPTSWLVRF